MLGVGSRTLLLGVSSGWLISMTEFYGRCVMEWVLLLPLAFPGYIIAIVYEELLKEASLWGLTIVAFGTLSGTFPESLAVRNFCSAL